MKATYGQSVTLTIAGESHGAALTAILAGLAPGLAVDEAALRAALDRRRPHGAISTARQEADAFEILSGVYNGYTTGTPITFVIRNADTRSRDYGEMASTARPGHADWAAQCKYHGFQDFRGGGHFSGRITAALTVAGALCREALRAKGIRIAAHIAACAGISDRAFGDLIADMDKLDTLDFAVLDEPAGQAMQQAILNAKADGDSVGGVLETAVVGLPCGVGEPFFDSVESQLAHVLFSIPAVKGVSFGDGFDLCNKRGSQTNDPLAVTDAGIAPVTNHLGGVCGGITDGSPLRFSCAIKPTPSIAKEQQTVDFKSHTDKTLTIHGRHDPAIVHRARVVVECATALTLCDMLAMRFGTDWLVSE
jgi:chorismate synthase